MPPIIAEKEVDDQLFSRMSSSVVTVYQKIDEEDETFGAGFVIHYDHQKILICVHHSIIIPGAELRVTFSDGSTRRANVFFNGDANLTHAVLLVNTWSTSKCSQVIFSQDPIGRERICTIATVEGNQGLGLMSGNIITPDCTALREDGSLIAGSSDVFAISCPAGGVSKQRPKGNAPRIIGAAIFNMKGQVVGTIKSIDLTGFDVKISMKVSAFLNTLEQSLQALDEKILISRSQSVSGMESSTAGDGMSQQRDRTSGSGSEKRSREHVHVSNNKTQKEICTHHLIICAPVPFAPPSVASLHQVAKMQSERGVSANRKRKFVTIDDGGDWHPADPDEEEAEEFGSSSDSVQSLWSMLIHQLPLLGWAPSVVSLTSLDEAHPACTGIVFHHTKTRACLLTSLSLFRSGDDYGKISFRTETKVRLPNHEVVNGILAFCDLKSNLSVVSVLPKGALLPAACLEQQQQLESHSQLVSLRRCFSSGQFLATAGMLAADPTCAYRQEAAYEGLLVDSLGNFVGLNCYSREGTIFIPRSTILEFVAGFQKARAKRRAGLADLGRKTGSQWELAMKKLGIKGRATKLKAWSPSHMSGLEGSSTLEKKQSACHYCDPEGKSAPGDRFKRLYPGPSWPADGDDVSKEAARNKLRSRGYPIPVKHDCGMRLLCSFERKFSEDTWSKLTEQVASDLSQSVVAVASFSGDKRFFSCTGIFIGCNEFTTRVLTSASLVRNPDDEAKVADNLKIEVCLPDNEHATGTLQHYNLHYNIAVISIMGSRCTQTAQIYDQLLTEPCGEVVAVGRVYESGKLMATHGTLIDKPSELDCKELKMSTCKITKAGIGGPLINRDGNFIGMDFYGLEETPYLPRNVVLEVLRSFDAKADDTDLVSAHNPNRWPVPKPFWCYPTWHQHMGEGVDEDDLPRPMWT